MRSARKRQPTLTEGCTPRISLAASRAACWQTSPKHPVLIGCLVWSAQKRAMTNPYNVCEPEILYFAHRRGVFRLIGGFACHTSYDESRLFGVGTARIRGRCVRPPTARRVDCQPNQPHVHIFRQLSPVDVALEVRESVRGALARAIERSRPNTSIGASMRASLTICFTRSYWLVGCVYQHGCRFFRKLRAAMCILQRHRATSWVPQTFMDATFLYGGMEGATSWMPIS